MKQFDTLAGKRYVEVGSGEPIESENLVEFHLLYSGPLHSGASEVCRKEKHAIRKVFHSQLRQLWLTEPNLKERTVLRGGLVRAKEISDDPRYATETPAEFSDEDAFQKGLEDLSCNWERNGFNFLPLVTEALCLRSGYSFPSPGRKELHFAGWGY